MEILNTIQTVIKIIIDNSLSLVLSGIVITFVIMLLKNAPKWVESIIEVIKQHAVSTDNNTEILKDVKKIFTESKEMHMQMEAKIKNIELEVNSLRSLIEENQLADEDYKRILNKQIDKLLIQIEKLHEKVDKK